MKAKVKIIATKDDNKQILANQLVKLTKTNNTYFFKIDSFSQQIKVYKDKIDIIRKEMTIKLKLNEVTKSTYVSQSQKLDIFFSLHKIKETDNTLAFNYSIVDPKTNKPDQMIDVKIQIREN